MLLPRKARRRAGSSTTTSTARADVDDWRASPLAREGAERPAACLRGHGAPLIRSTTEGVEYKDRLKAAGVEVTYSDYPGQFHGFCAMMGKLIPASQQADQRSGAVVEGKGLGFARAQHELSPLPRGPLWRALRHHSGCLLGEGCHKH